MAEYIVTDSELTSIADAIREKDGTSESLTFPNGFVNAIDAIKTSTGDNIMESVLTLGSNAFESKKLNSILFFKSLTTVGSRTFRYVTGPSIGVFPQLTSAGEYAFADTREHSFEVLDFGRLSSISSYFFSGCVLQKLILRNNSLVRLINTNGVAYTSFADDQAGGILYVPQALIADYQSATNWSTILEYENNQILPIEGSIYETQYADGTFIE